MSPSEYSKLTITLILIVAIQITLARSTAREQINEDDSINAVIPSPNDDYGEAQIEDIKKITAGLQSASHETPVYVSPFVRPAASAAVPLPLNRASIHNIAPQESSHAPSKYAMASDLKASASHGYHGHHGHGYGYGPSGWLDMGAWTGGKGSFGWYADYPVGSHKHHGYGRR